MKKKLTSVLLVGTILFAMVGCSTLAPSEYYIPEVTSYIIPEIGVVNKANIGDPLLKEGKVSEQKMIVLKETNGVLGFTAYHPAGEYRLVGMKNGYSIYEYDQQFENGWTSVYPQILEDESGSVYLKTNSGKKLLSENEYIIKNVVEDASNNYEQTLVYTGAEGNILKFTYREFISDMARPAFTIDATYDLTKDNNIIKFKNVAIEVIDFSNQEITYRLLSGFKN
jgi:hypothetical protein